MALVDSDFSSPVEYQGNDSVLFLKIDGFSVSCGKLELQWTLLVDERNCILGATSLLLPTGKTEFILTGLRLKQDKTYKVAVLATTIRSQGTTTVCSNIITIDTSTPTAGWIRDGFGTNDLQYQSSQTIKASWGGFKTKYGIAKYQVSIQYLTHSTKRKHIVLAFTNVGVNVSLSRLFTEIPDGSKVKTTVRAYTKAGKYIEVSSDGVTVDTSPPNPGKVFDGFDVSSNLKYVNWSFSYLASWTHFEDVHSPVTMYKIGVIRKNGGLVTSLLPLTGVQSKAKLTGLNLVSGIEYCALVEGVNAAGLSSQAFSDCVLVDQDDPQPGVVNDGNSSDVDYQSVNTSFSANWDGFTDGLKGSGIKEYKCLVENKMGQALTDWIPVGNKQKVTVNVNLVNDETYYIKVRAYDVVGHYTEVKSDGVRVDTSHPVYSGDITILGRKEIISSHETVVYIKSNTSITASWPQFIDEHSGMKKYQYSIFKDDDGEAKWTDVPGSNVLKTDATFWNLNLTNGRKYRLAIRGVNNAGTYSIAKSSKFIPQSIPPNLGVVYDGVTRDVDADYQTYTSSVSASWKGFDSNGVRVKTYYIGIGSCMLGNVHITDNTFITVIPSNATSYTVTGLKLVNGQKYCVKVKGENYAGIQTIPVSSNGITVDVTHPITNQARVFDGEDENDIDFTYGNSLSAVWSGIQDPESGIKAFEVAVSRKRSGIPDVTAFKNVRLKESVTFYNLKLVNGVYYIVVCAINQAGLKSCLSSDGVFVDNSLPSTGAVNDGIIEPDIQYQSSTTSISANWENIWDLDSAIKRFEWGVGSNNSDYPNIKHFEDVGLQTYKQSENNLKLNHGHMYYVYLRVYNKAGATYVLRSNGVSVDTTAPIPTAIYPSMSNWTFNERTKTYYSSNTSGIFVTWNDFEENESALWYYKWSIGTSSCGTQIQPFINVGLSSTANVTTKDIHILTRKKYYITILARNRAGLFSRKCLYPILFDNTPPRIGKIEVTSSDGMNRSYFAHGDIIFIKWEGFYDFESEIEKYEVNIKGNDGYSLTVTTQTSNTNHSIISDKLFPRRSYVVSLTVYNQAKLFVSVESHKFVVDDSPPVYSGGLDELPRKRFESNLNHFKISWQPFLDDESPISHYEIGIGTRPFKDDIHKFSETGLRREFQNKDFVIFQQSKKYYVTVKAVNQAGLNLSLIVEELTIDNTPAVCNNQCVFDGESEYELDFMSSNDSISGHWSNVKDIQSGIKVVEYCVGTNPFNCLIKSFTDISQNRSFLCNDCIVREGMILFTRFRFTNGAGMSSILASDGVRIDLSPPIIGRISDGSGNQDVNQVDVRWSPSVTWYGATDPESGIRYCKWCIVEKNDTEVSTCLLQLKNVTYGVRQTLHAKFNFNNNRRYYNSFECINQAGNWKRGISDGFDVAGIWPIPSYVIDGINTDIEYITSDSTITASWGVFEGNERDPVVKYEWGLGSRVGKVDIMPFKNVGMVNQVSQSLLETDVILEQGGRYYVTVQATTLSGRKSNGSSNGIVVDTTYPTGSTVSIEPEFISQKEKLMNLKLNWKNFTDNESGIKLHGYCVGLMENECYTDAMDSLTANEVVVENIQLDNNGLSYYGIVWATNKAGLTSIVSSKPMTISFSETIEGSVYDGLYDDLDFITLNVPLTTSWMGFSRERSDVKKCYLSVNEQSLRIGTLVVRISKLEINSSGNVTHKDLSLVPGFRYISIVECYYQNGFKVSVSSDGVVVDDTPPVATAIFDGDQLMKDIDYQSDRTCLKVNWLPAFDKESDIKEYRIAIGSGSKIDNVKPFVDVGLATATAITNVSLETGKTYFVTLEIVNHAGLTTQVSANGITIDTSLPQILKVRMTIFNNSI